MNTTPAKRAEQPSPSTVEDVLIRGDLSQLTEQQRTEYYMSVCQSLGLNPLTKPFDYLMLSGKLVLYAKRDAADQLRKLNGISIKIVGQSERDGLLTVHAQATDKTGRTDEDFGVVAFKGGANEIAANTIMKAVTKAKRRVTLSISGLGLLDETEVGADEPDKPTGEVINLEQLDELIEACDSIGGQYRGKISNYYNVSSLADLTVEQYDDAIGFIERRRKAIESAGGKASP